MGIDYIITLLNEYKFLAFGQFVSTGLVHKSYSLYYQCKSYNDQRKND